MSMQAVTAPQISAGETAYRYWSFWASEDDVWTYATQGPATMAVADGMTWPAPTSLHAMALDPNELVNLAAERPDKLAKMQDKLQAELLRLQAPQEQALRLGLA